jgi:hypothetical protein
MRTIVAGLVFVLLTYLAQSAIVAFTWGPLIALVYLASLPIAAEINFYASERLRRATHRARTYLRFRRDPELHARLAASLAGLRTDVLALDRALGNSGDQNPMGERPGGETSPPDPSATRPA